MRFHRFNLKSSDRTIWINLDRVATLEAVYNKYTAISFGGPEGSGWIVEGSIQTVLALLESQP